MIVTRLGGRLAGWKGSLVLALAAIWLLLQSLAQRPDHDESQYVAGAVLAVHALPYRDFLLLQPPLHAWVFAPIAWMWPTDSFVAMRIATGVLAIATMGAVMAAQRAAGIPSRIALAATLLMASCASFQFSAGVVRNDMLPACLAAIGIWALLRGAPAATFVGGVAFGLAMATKLSFVPLAAAAGLFLALDARKGGPGPLATFAAGSLAGLAPALAAFAAAPANFLWGVFTFAATAPFEWYARVGRGEELVAAEKVVDLLHFLLVGPGLVALGLVAWRLGREKLARWTAQERMLALLVLGGLIGAALPTPSHKQYLLPLLPPLFIALGQALAARPPALPARLLLAVSALVGLAPSTVGIAHAARSGFPSIHVDAVAREIGVRMRAIGGGTVATLSPDRVADSGVALDARFATGPFVFRSGALLDAQLASRLNVVTPATLDHALDTHSPRAILVGYEDRWRMNGKPVDSLLEAYAQQRHWHRIALRGSSGRLYIRPRAGSALALR